MVGSFGLAVTWGFVLSAMTAQLPPPPAPEPGTAQAQPRLHVAKRMVDLGKMMDGDKKSVTWTLENRGSADLVIQKTTSSCGCTVMKVSLDDTAITPGKSLVLTAEFDSTRRRGLQKKYVTVFTNDPDEPKLKLEFQAQVDYLFDVVPQNVLNLQMLRRGETADKSLDLLPAPGRTLELVDVLLAEDVPLTWARETFTSANGVAYRIKFTVSPTASLGRISGEVTARFKVDGVEREAVVSLRCHLVGDLSAQPKVVDATRQPSKRGKELAPVTIKSTSDNPFDIVSAGAGPWLDVTYESLRRGKPNTQYKFLLTIRDDAPSGPFGTMLRVETTCLDQPIVFVPVFGIVAPRIDVAPPIVLLRQDGTPAGTRRQVTLKAWVSETLDITAMDTGLPAVEATIDESADRRHRHMMYLRVSLTGEMAKGVHETTLTVTTTVSGAERLEIPVRIEVP